MSDFYRELETSLTGRRPRGMGPLGWLAIFFFVFVGLAGAAAWTGFAFMKGKVEAVLADARESPSLVAARMLSRMDPELQVLGDQGREGAAALKDLRSGQVSSFLLRDLIEGSLSIRTEKGDVSIDLKGDEQGGTLVVETPEGRTTAELQVEKDSEGGSLVVRSPEGEVRIGAGSEARALPDWLPVEGSMPSDAKHIYSAVTEESVLGAVAWRTEGRPERILSWYEDQLEESGFERVTRSWSEHGDERQGSLWAEDGEGRRTAFLVVAREDEGTSVVLGYGEKR